MCEGQHPPNANMFAYGVWMMHMYMDTHNIVAISYNNKTAGLVGKQKQQQKDNKKITKNFVFSTRFNINKNM